MDNNSSQTDLTLPYNGSSSTLDIQDEKTEKVKSTKTFKEVRGDIFFSAFLVLIYSYFVWATVHFVQNTDASFDSTTCTGYGFTTILYILITYGLLHKYFVAPYLKVPFKKLIWYPAVDLLQKIKYGDKIFYIAFFALAIAFLVWDSRHDWSRLMPLTGLAIFLTGGYLCSHNRKLIPWRTVFWGIILQFVFGLFTIRWEVGRNIFRCFGDKVTTFLNYAQKGAAFVYTDYLVYDVGVFAFQSLSTIFMLGFIVNILYYYGVMQKCVSAIGGFLHWMMGTTICESMNTAANIFLGQSESPLLLKPYLKDLTTSEIHCVLTSGFATVAGTVMAAYISFGASAAHLITSSVMSAPSALCYSKLLYPEDETPKMTKDHIKLAQNEFNSAMDAATKGAMDAMALVLGIISSLIAFISALAAINGVLAFMGEQVGFTGDSEWSAQLIMGKVFIPVSYTIGVPWNETELVGRLIGVKTMVNEFVAFQEMQNMTLTPRTKVIATYAICGFSNPGSIGIMVSALATLMPNKRDNVNKVIFRSFIAGAIVCLMTACIAGVLIPEDMTDI